MQKLLEELLEKGIFISCENENLKIKYDGEKISDSLLEEIRKNKQELLTYLKKYNGQLSHRFIAPIAQSESYELSYAQKRLWILSKVEDGALSYNMANQTILHGKYDIESFQKAIQSTINHHEILRTVFRENELGEVRQWILDISDFNFKIDYQDFRILSSEQQDEKVQAYIDLDSIKPFDFENGPLLRATMFQLAEETYIFYYNMHHIISDGWSMDVLSKNVFSAYQSIITRSIIELPELKIQYKDYAAWQIKQLETSAFQVHKQYWIESLSDELPVVDFPSFKKRPIVKTNNGRSLATYIPKSTIQKLKTFCQDRKGSVFMGLLSAFNTLFYRYTQQEDFIVGTPVAGRDHIDLENQIGFYVNTLTLRNQLTSNDTFEDVFQNIKNVTLGAYEHQAYPFDQLVQELGLKRDVGRSVVFDVMFTLHNIDNKDLVHQVIESQFEKIEDKGSILSKFDLELNFQEVEDFMYCDIVYNTDVYNKETIEMLIQHFKGLLIALLENPNKKVNEINFLSIQENKLLLEDFNDTDVDYNNQITILDLFKSQVAENPERTVLVYDDLKMTFGELDEKSNQLAHFLSSKALNNVLIPICFDRSFEMVISILAILKSGNAYVPIDTNYPKERINYIINDTQAKLLLCGSLQKENFNIENIIDLDHFQYNLYSKEDLAPKVTSNQLAYCIYTSGTTGNPKGVLNAHSGLLNRLLWMKDDLNINNNSIILQKTPYIFDVSVWELTMPLITGCKLVIAKPDGHSDPEYIQEIISKEKVSIIHFVPSMLNVFLDSIQENQMASLASVVCSGEVLSPAVVSKFKQLLKGINIYNLYGPTEAAIDVTSINLILTDTQKNGVTIGKPVANTQLYVVNDALQLQPIGAIGELLIGGIQVAKGYLNKPELTSEKFIQDTFKNKGTLYKTGDLVRWLPDGNIEYLGRKDDQVKIRGYRIELGEIERNLEQLDEIKQAVVIVKKEGENAQLLSYIVANGQIDKSEIQRKLQQKLPEYMVPSIYVEIDSIPLTVNGKVNRKALPNPSVGDFKATNYIAPRNEREQKLIAIWQELLGLPQIGVYDNFFTLGGDSIIAIQFVTRAKKESVFLKVKDVFKYQTIDGIVKNLSEKKEIISEQGILEGEVKLLPIQNHFFEKEYINNNHFNQSILLTISKDIDPLFIEKAVTYLYQKHDMLRVKYSRNEEGYVGNYNAVYPSLEIITISTEESFSDTISQTCQTYQSGLSIENGDLSKFVFIETPSIEFYNRLFITIHHLAIDGVSWRILIEDLTEFIDNLINDKPIVLGGKLTSYRQWQERLQEYANSEKIKAEYSFWKSSVEKIKPLPQDFHFDSKTNYSDNKTLTVELSKEQTQSLLQDCHTAFKTEINDLLLTALSISLSNWIKDSNVVIGLEGHGREELFDDIDLNKTLGWFTTLYPIVLESFTNDIEATIVQTKENLRVIPDKGIGYGLLRYLSSDKNIQRNLSANIDQVIFNYLGQIDKTSSEVTLFDFAQENKGDDISSSNHNSTKIAINGSIVNGVLSLTWSYDSNRFDEKTIKNLTNDYKKAISDIITLCKNKGKNTPTPFDYGLGGVVTYHDLKAFMQHAHPYVIEDIYKLSPLQEGMLFHSVYNQNSNVYVSQLSFDLIGELNLEKFKEAWKATVNKHSILRTSFFSDQMSVPVQCVYKEIDLPLTIFDFQQKEKSEIDEAIKIIMNEQLNNPFDLKQPPLFRLVLIMTPENKTKLIYTGHHIISDGWSSPILFGEFMSNYQSLKIGDNVVDSLKDNYKDYIDYIHIKDQFQTLSYWKDRLKDLKTPSILPFINNLESQQNLISENKINTLKKDVEYIGKLEEFSKINHLTINTIIQGVWSYLLSLYTNNETIVFGTVISGRPTELKDIESRIGLYINTIPLCTTIIDNESIISWLTNIQNTYTISREEYGHSSLSDVQKQTGIIGDLFDSLLVFENYPLESINSIKSDISVENISVKQQNNFPLTISTRHFVNRELIIEFEYNSQKISCGIVEMIQNHFNNLLDSILREEKLANLEVLDIGEKNELIELFNDTKVAYLEGVNVLDLFNEQLLSKPNELALVFDDKSFTYSDLDDLSNKLSNCLLEEYKVKQGSFVGIKLDRSEWMVISILSILKLGAAYVPIDPEYTSSRELHIIEDSGINLLITETNYLFDFSDFEGIVFSIDVDFDSNNYSNTKPIVEISSNDVAYVIYTSGSTGKPKGVVITHKSLINYLYWAKNEYLIANNCENNDFGLYTSLSFDLTVTSLFLPLISGGKLHVFSQGNISKILKSYLKSNISCIKLTPAHISLLKEIEVVETNLEIAIVGGDALQSHHVEILRNLNPTMKIFNEYGPTEATVGCMIYEVPFESKEILIGKPIANTEVYILNSTQKLLPKGIAGEIYIGGSGLAKEYLNNSDLTTEKFIKNPYKSDELLYKTGDFGKWLLDGNMVYLGREDNQVKIRGYRIEIGEIEQQLMKNDKIKNAFVLVNCSKDNEKELIAYIVFEKEQQTVNELRQFLSESLPHYMIPNYFIPLNEIPLTINGKIDSESLPSPENLGLLSGIENVAPRNEIEEKLAEIWSEHLSIKNAGIKDDYFNLGGDSIKMIRFLNLINKFFNTDIPIATFYENPTIEGLALFIQENNNLGLENLTRTEIENSLFEIEKRVLDVHPLSDSIANVYPMSDIQMGMILTSQLMRDENDFGIYHDQFLFQLGAINLELLTRAMELMVEKHETLRTSYNFYDFEDQVQIIHKKVPVNIDFEDISHLGKNQKENFISNFLENERKFNPFDIKNAPVWRINIFKIGEIDNMFVFQFHHAMIDGWGEKNFRVELFEIYKSLEKNIDYRPRLLLSSIRDSVISDLMEVKNEKSISFWRNKMTDYKRLEIFSQNHIDNQIDKVYDESFSEKIIDKCRREKISPKALFLSAYIYILNLLSSENDITLGIVAHRRPMVEDGDKLLGCFLNSVPFRFDMKISSNSSWEEFVKQIDSDLRELQGKDRFSLNEISNLVGENSNENPFFDALFNFVDFHVLNTLYDNKDFQSGQSERQLENFEFQDFERTNTFLNFTFSINPKDISISCSQIRELKSMHKLKDLIAYCDNFLENYLFNGSEKINNCKVIQASEILKITEIFNDSSKPNLGVNTITQLFERQVKETPNEIAVSYNNKVLTYEELNSLSNRFASFLIVDHKISKGEFVGVKIERTDWAIVVIFGILKAAAVYVPIDPNYPQSRIEFIENDSQCKVCIDTQILSHFISNYSSYNEDLISISMEPSDLAYVIYTSGSTGNPKGVMIENKSILNTILSQIEAFDLKDKKRNLQFASLSFDASIWECFMTLLSGSSLYMVSEEMRQDPKALGNFILNNGIEILTLPPAYLKLMEIDFLKDVKILITAGEPPIYNDVKRYLEISSGSYFNAYGPTEVSICGSTFKTNKVTDLDINIPIGKPIDNTKFYILDDFNQIKPIGVVGEICISGPGLSRGYLNLVELTNEKFIPNPLNDSELLYKTGDLGRWNWEGNMEFIGRNDNQVKIRGHRIELGEIERQLMLKENIEEVVAIAIDNKNNEKQIAVFYVSQNEEKIIDIRNFLLEALPVYMLPDIYVQLELMPLTPNGKIDKKLILETNINDNLVQSQYMAPRDETEKKLADLWAEVLNKEKIGINESFFEIGGNSLKAIQLISRIRKEFNVNLDVVSLYNNATIIEIKNQIENFLWVNQDIIEEDVEKFSF